MTIIKKKMYQQPQVAALLMEPASLIAASDNNGMTIVFDEEPSILPPIGVDGINPTLAQ